MRRFVGAILCITKTLKFNDFKQQASLVTAWSSWTGWAWSLTVFTWWFTQLGLGVLHGFKQVLVFTRLRHRSSQVYRGDCVSPCGLSHFWRSGLASSHSGREGKYRGKAFSKPLWLPSQMSCQSKVPRQRSGFQESSADWELFLPCSIWPNGWVCSVADFGTTEMRGHRIQSLQWMAGKYM